MPPVGLLVPGRALNTDFRQIGPQKLVIDIPMPGRMNEFAVMLLEPPGLANHGLGVYYTTPPNFDEWVYIGCVTVDSPSQFFHAPWRGEIPEGTALIQLGVSLEPLETLANLKGSGGDEEKRQLDSAKGIAQDLFNFMASFGRSQTDGNMLLIPLNCIDKWYHKFLHKHQLDPYFWIKKQ